MPTQTYDYVFYIVSAAVIGENPRLFGFPFDNPLLSVDQAVAVARGKAVLPSLAALPIRCAEPVAANRCSM